MLDYNRFIKTSIAEEKLNNHKYMEIKHYILKQPID